MGLDPGECQMESEVTASQKRILLVDDDPLTLVFLERMLIAEGDGWRAVKALGGPQALAELEDQCIDLIVTDYRMPGMTGLELVQAVRRRLPDTPVILITADASQELREEAHHLGVFCVLPKPVRAHILRRAVREASGCGRQDRGQG